MKREGAGQGGTIPETGGTGGLPSNPKAYTALGGVLAYSRDARFPTSAHVLSNGG